MVGIFKSRDTSRAELIEGNLELTVTKNGDELAFATREIENGDSLVGPLKRIVVKSNAVLWGGGSFTTNRCYFVGPQLKHLDGMPPRHELLATYKRALDAIAREQHHEMHYRKNTSPERARATNATLMLIARLKRELHARAAYAFHL